VRVYSRVMAGVAGILVLIVLIGFAVIVGIIIRTSWRSDSPGAGGSDAQGNTSRDSYFGWILSVLWPPRDR
jgi:uncharacterized membrane protein YedE/YeeE